MSARTNVQLAQLEALRFEVGQRLLAIRPNHSSTNRLWLESSLRMHDAALRYVQEQLERVRTKDLDPQLLDVLASISSIAELATKQFAIAPADPPDDPPDDPSEAG